MSTKLSKQHEQKLHDFAQALVNQQDARVIVPAQQASTGFWFGGGNMIQDTDGSLVVVGRYRNFGDSRTGVGAGERGLELAIFRSTDRGQTFEKVVSRSKSDLNVPRDGEEDLQVLSIEGSALHRTPNGVELFVSTEKKNLGYPEGFESFLKPGAGVWTIERLVAPSVEALADAPIETVLQTDDPRYLHIKDPFVYDAPNGDLALFFCTHPFGWSSSNTGVSWRRAEQGSASSFTEPDMEFFPRGTTWDVAITRGTAVIDVPAVGDFAGLSVSLIFYDGGECLRNLDEHKYASARPRGYSCEELGGVAYMVDGDLNNIHRLSTYLPSFVSPWGTGCSRYVDVLTTEEGFYTTWQQSKPDLSQPLVMHHLTTAAAVALLS